MPQWWYSVAALHALQGWTNAAFVTLALLLAAIGVARWRIDARVDELRAIAQAPRSLRSEQRARLVDFVRQSPPGPVRVWFAQDSGESEAFAKELDSALREAGWKPPEPARFFGRSPSGLLVTRRNPGNTPPHFAPLCRALGTAGLQPQCAIASKMGDDDALVSVIVGARP